jgi:chitinase
MTSMFQAIPLCLSIILILVKISHGQNCARVGCSPGFCCSKWGFCGDSPLHCGPGSTTTRATTTTTRTTTSTTTRTMTTTTQKTTTSSSGSETNNKITREQFDCIFWKLSEDVRDKRWQGYQEALSMVSFKPQNQNELIMFFAHVSHETDSLQTYEEYCGKSKECASSYQISWCGSATAEPGKHYYGRGWFQLSFPCNYNAAGQALGIDLLKNPEKVAESDALAAATGMWFWNANNIGQPARQGNFGVTTQIINSLECGPTPQQTNRISRYQEVRLCFGLERDTENLRC